MLIVTNNNQTEAILESNYEKYEEQNGAALRISFSSFNFAGNIGHELLDYEVTVEDEDGHEYKVKQYQQDGTEKKITATHIFYELKDAYKYDIYGGTRTLDDFATWLLNGTGWTFENVDITDYAMMTNYGEGNVITLLQTLINAFKCEFKVLPNKVIRFAKVIGEDNDLQYRYKYNISELTQSIDTTSLKTQIRGYGADNLILTYTSPLASHPRIGVRVAEPIYNDSVTTEAELIELLKAELPDAPETIIEVKVTDVDGEVGDTVWIIHEELDLSYQTRILSKKTKRHYADSTITVGNTTRKDITDILVSQKATIDENNRMTRSRFEQTNDRITLEVEEIDKNIATLEIRANEIAMSVVDLENNLTSTISQTADTIRAEVVAEVTTINASISTTNNNVASLQIQTNNISSTVTSQSTQISNLGTRVSSAESSITQHDTQIASKVSQTDYNGNTIASLINQTASSVTIDADKINLNGAIMANGTITGSSSISVTTDVNVGRNIIMQGSGGGEIRFPGNDSVIYSNGTGYAGIRAWNGILLNAPEIDFSAASRLIGVARGHTEGIGIAYSTASNRLYVRIDGANVGYIKLTTD